MVARALALLLALAAPSFASTPTFTPVVCSAVTSTLAEYRFEQNGNDSSGNGNNLTTVGTIPYSGSIYKEGAYSAGPFSTSNYFTLPAGSIVFGTNSFTISTWFYYSSGSNQIIYENTGANTVDFFVISNTFKVTIQDVVNVFTYALGSPSNSWILLTVTYSYGNWTYYVNGTQEGTASQSFTGTETAGYLGNDSTTTRPVTGYLDDFRLYNCVLSAAEVSTLASGPTPTPTFTPVVCSAVTSTLAEYRFEQNGNDSSGNGNNLTTVGTIPYSGSIYKEGAYSAGPFSTSNYFTLPAGSIVFGTNSFTISTWFYYSSGSNQIIYENTGANTVDFFVISNSFKVTIQDVVNVFTYPLGSPSNSWILLTVTYSYGNWTYYVNGTQEGTASQSFTGTETAGYLGNDSTTTRPVTGYLDDFRLYNCVLSAAEVSTLASGPTPTPTWTPTATPSVTPTWTKTASPTPTFTPTATPGPICGTCASNTISYWTLDNTSADSCGSYPLTESGISFASTSCGGGPEGAQATAFGLLAAPSGFNSVFSSRSAYSVEGYVYTGSGSGSLDQGTLYTFTTASGIHTSLTYNQVTRALTLLYGSGTLSYSTTLSASTCYDVAVSYTGFDLFLWVNGSPTLIATSSSWGTGTVTSFTLCNFFANTNVILTDWRVSSAAKPSFPTTDGGACTVTVSPTMTRTPVAPTSTPTRTVTLTTNQIVQTVVASTHHTPGCLTCREY